MKTGNCVSTKQEVKTPCHLQLENTNEGQLNPAQSTHILYFWEHRGYGHVCVVIDAHICDHFLGKYVNLAMFVKT